MYSLDMLFKVTHTDGRCYYGGRGQWPLPTLNPDGTWTPGEPLEVVGPLRPCQHGLHLVQGHDLPRWLGPAIWVAEYDTTFPAESVADKVVVTRARLVRGTPWDDRIARHFACDCATRAMTRVHDPNPQSREAIAVARRYADGRASNKELRAACISADAAAHNAATFAAADAAIDAAWPAAAYAAYAASAAAVDAPANANAERVWQANRILHYLNGGQPEIE